MPQIYTVQQGDHASSIAEKFGFADFATIWNDPLNAALRQIRDDPHVLNPGDQIAIPDKKDKKASAPSGQVSTFVLQGKKLQLRLMITDAVENPIANTPCQLTVDGKAQTLSTDANGIVSQPILRTARSGDLKLLDFDAPIRIGDLDTIDQVSGQCARLNNLGYFAGVPGGDSLQFRSAVEEFQCDNGLTLSGQCDAPTQAALKQVHGS
ncbi:MAG TPA: peptidoglycan-binding protein [Bryobacteraceae bacterium]|nr:peptidoglycan-binding protein [Bryobacteraceae bacterium]